MSCQLVSSAGGNGLRTGGSEQREEEFQCRRLENLCRAKTILVEAVRASVVQFTGSEVPIQPLGSYLL